MPRGSEAPRSGDAHGRAELAERVDVRARDAAVEDVADDRDAASPVERASCARRIVPQSSSACVGCSCVPSPALTTRRAHVRREHRRRAGRAVADHDHVGLHRVDVARGVEQRLALLRGRKRLGDVDHVGAQTLRRDLERRARARRRLHEEVHHRAARRATSSGREPSWMASARSRMATIVALSTRLDAEQMSHDRPCARLGGASGVAARVTSRRSQSDRAVRRS